MFDIDSKPLSSVPNFSKSGLVNYETSPLRLIFRRWSSPFWPMTEPMT